MVIPIANVIFENKLIINDFVKLNSSLVGKELIFKKVDKKISSNLLKNRTKYYPPIIINASNELAVSYFLQKIPYEGIAKVVLSVLKDRNYKKMLY